MLKLLTYTDKHMKKNVQHHSLLEKGKTKLRYHLTPVKMAIIKKSTTISAREDVEKSNPLEPLVGM